MTSCLVGGATNICDRYAVEMTWMRSLSDKK